MISITIIICQVTICGVCTQDVLNKSLLELMKLSGCCGLTVQDLYHKCCLTQAVTPATVSAEDDDGYEGDSDDDDGGGNDEDNGDNDDGDDEGDCCRLVL